MSSQDQSSIYRKEVASLVERLLVKKDGAIIMNTPEYKMGLGKDQVIIFIENKEKVIVDWDELNDEELYAIYCFLDTAQKLSPEIVDNFVELGSADEKTWHIEPRDVTDFSGKVPLGKIGVAVESRTDAGEQLAVIFISPDNTWTTLTMYDKCLNDEVLTARGDLNDIAKAISKFAETL